MKSSDTPRRSVTIAVVVFALLVAYMVMKLDTSSGTLLSPGSEAPPIRALGWLNDGPVGEEQLAGNVVVIDCFASW